MKIADDGTISFRDNERVGVDYLFGRQLSFFVPFATVPYTFRAHVCLLFGRRQVLGRQMHLDRAEERSSPLRRDHPTGIPRPGAVSCVVCWPSPLMRASQRFHWCRGSTGSTRSRPTSSLAVWSSALSQVLNRCRCHAAWRGCLTWRMSSQCLSCMAGTAATGRPRPLRRFSGTIRMVFRPPYVRQLPAVDLPDEVTPSAPAWLGSPRLLSAPLPRPRQRRVPSRW